MESWVEIAKPRGVEHDDAAPSLEVFEVTVVHPVTKGARLQHDHMTPGDQTALERVSFRLQRGQQAAVVGPNGAGKSTLLQVIAGTIKPTRGLVRVYGHEPDKHVCIGYVPQRNLIDWTFPVTVEDVVMMGRVGQIGLFRWPGRGDWDLVKSMLARMRLEHLAKKQIGELSGGQQQRAFIARALAQGTDLMLLDEPFAGLDVAGREAILDALTTLRGDGVTVLVATHDLDLAAERFDRVMLLNKKVIAFGTAQQVLDPSFMLQAFGVNAAPAPEQRDGSDPPHAGLGHTRKG